MHRRRIAMLALAASLLTVGILGVWSAWGSCAVGLRLHDRRRRFGAEGAAVAGSGQHLGGAPACRGRPVGAN